MIDNEPKDIMYMAWYTPKGKTISRQEYNNMIEERFKNATKTKSGNIIIETMTIGG